MTIVDPKFAAFVLEVEKHFSAALDTYIGDLEYHVPIGFQITTSDGVAARFYEEGVEFYPKPETTTT